jgi:hypothetical protein
LSSFEKERIMAVVARIIGYSLLTAGPGVLLFGGALCEHDGGSALIGFVLGCVGAIVGVVAGAAGEIVAAQRRFARSEAMKPVSNLLEFGD